MYVFFRYKKAIKTSRPTSHQTRLINEVSKLQKVSRNDRVKIKSDVVKVSGPSVLVTPLAFIFIVETSPSQTSLWGLSSLEQFAFCFNNCIATLLWDQTCPQPCYPWIKRQIMIHSQTRHFRSSKLLHET